MAFVAALMVVRPFLRFVSRSGFAPFAWYRIVVGLMILAVVLLIVLNFQAMIDTFGSGAALVAVLFVLVLVGVGYTCGGPSPATRSVLGLGTGQRNIAAALIVATQNAMGPQVVVMLLISTLVGLVVLLPAAVWFARRPSPASARVMGVFVDPIRKEVVR